MDESGFSSVRATLRVTHEGSDFDVESPLDLTPDSLIHFPMMLSEMKRAVGHAIARKRVRLSECSVRFIVDGKDREVPEEFRRELWAETERGLFYEMCNCHSDYDKVLGSPRA